MLYDIDDYDEQNRGRPRVVRMVDWGSDYPDADEWSTTLERAVLEYVVANRVQICGNCHQHRPLGAPQFSDGTVWRESMKNWGVTMGDAWDREFGAAMWSYHTGCHQCDDRTGRRDWNTWAGPLPPPVEHPPVDPSKVIRLGGLDVLMGFAVIRPELGAKLIG